MFVLGGSIKFSVAMLLHMWQWELENSVDNKNNEKKIGVALGERTKVVKS